MSQAENEKSRRDFMKGSGAAAGTMALASIFAGKVEAHEVDGLNPTPEKVPSFSLCMGFPNGGGRGTAR